MMSHHSIRYFENGISFGCVGSTSLLFLLGFLLLGFLFAIIIVRVVYPVKHIKEILFGHYKTVLTHFCLIRHLYMKNIFFSNALKKIESVELYGILAIIVVAVDE